MRRAAFCVNAETEGFGCNFDVVVKRYTLDAAQRTAYIGSAVERLSPNGMRDFKFCRRGHVGVSKRKLAPIAPCWSAVSAASI